MEQRVLDESGKDFKSPLLAYLHASIHQYERISFVTAELVLTILDVFQQRPHLSYDRPFMYACITNPTP